MHCNIQSITEYAVAPRVGAWIETFRVAHTDKWVDQSHPEWVRGLKLRQGCMGQSWLVSHPEWVRGLKHAGNLGLTAQEPSHPEWVRGLKRHREP